MRNRRTMVLGASFVVSFAMAGLSPLGVSPVVADASSSSAPFGQSLVLGVATLPPTAAPPAFTRTTLAPLGSSRLTIEPVWDSSVTNSPDATKIEQAFNEAAAQIESQYSDPITVKVEVVFSDSSGLGSSQSYFLTGPYDVLRGALVANAITKDQLSAVQNLPSTPPWGSDFAITVPDAEVLGLIPSDYSPPTGQDATITLSSNQPFAWDPTSPNSTGFDPVATFEHEISEAMGRIINFPSSSWLQYGLLGNLFDYAAPGELATSQSTGDYLSADGGVTSLVPLNGQSGGDSGDYADPNPDAFNAFAAADVTEPITEAGLTNLDLLGYHRVPLSLTVTASSATTQPHTVVTFSATGQDSAGGAMDYTNLATFSIVSQTTGRASGASCIADRCLVSVPGSYTVTGTYEGISGTTTLTVQP